MKSVKPVAILAIVALTLAMIPCVASDTDADAVDGPTITEAGFAETQESLFYLAKFGIFLFPYTGGSVSNDTPVAGVGLNMSDNTLFATLSGLDSESEYYLFIEEYSGGSEPTAEVCISIGSGNATAGVWMSVSEGSAAFVNGEEAAYEFREGSFSENVSGCSYVLKLVSEEGVSVSTVTDLDILSEAEVENPSNYSLIVDYGTYRSDESDLVQFFGNRYGFSSTGAVRYAGAESDYSTGDYLCMVIFTNLVDPEITVTSGSSSYAVPSSDIYNGNSDNGADAALGYALVVVPMDDLEAAGISDLNSYEITIGDGSSTYDSVTYGEESGSDGDNTLAIVAIAIVAVILIVIVAVWYMRSGKVGKKEE